MNEHDLDEENFVVFMYQYISLWFQQDYYALTTNLSFEEFALPHYIKEAVELATCTLIHEGVLRGLCTRACFRRVGVDIEKLTTFFFRNYGLNKSKNMTIVLHIMSFVD